MASLWFPVRARPGWVAPLALSSIGCLVPACAGLRCALGAHHQRRATIVLGQPALPLGRVRASGAGKRTLQAVQEKGLPEEILYLRFERDCLSLPAKLVALERALSPIHLTSFEFQSTSTEHHSVLTDSALETPEAFTELLAYLNRRLKPASEVP